MAKKVSDDAPKPNHFDPKRIARIIDKIETEHEGLLAEKMSYMGRCGPYRQRIAAAYEEGVGFDISKAVLKAKIKERAYQRKIDCIAGDFEDDERETFEQLTQALGALADTPLGQAALDATAAKEAAPAKARRAPKPKASFSDAPDDDEADLRPGFMRDADDETRANAAALEAGIRPLPN